VQNTSFALLQEAEKHPRLHPRHCAGRSKGLHPRHCEKRQSLCGGARRSNLFTQSPT